MASFRAGDWNCPACNAHNFASKTACFRCQAPKPDNLPPDGGYGGFQGGGGYGGGYGGGGYGDPMGQLGANLHSVQWGKEQLATFQKDFYIEHPDVTRRTDAECDQFRQERKITVMGRGCPKPITTFDEASFPGTEGNRST